MPTKNKTQTKKPTSKMASKRKTTTRSRALKKVVSKKASKKTLPVAVPEKRFWVHNGPILGDMRELYNALEHELNDEQFKHHVGAKRNDFAQWVQDVLGDRTCATKLKRMKTRKSMAKAVKECVEKYA